MKNIRKLINLVFKLLIELPIYHLSGTIRKNNKLWLISHSGGFRDNSKYFFVLYRKYIKEKYDIDLVWVAKNKEEYNFINNIFGKEHPCVYLYSIKSLKALITAKVYISSNAIGDDLPFLFSKKAKNIYLWHGVGIKNMLYKDKNSMVYKLSKYSMLKVLLPKNFKKPDLVLASSPIMKKHLAECFGISEDKAIISSYPRNKIIQESKTNAYNFVKKHKEENNASIIESIDKYKKSIIYMPTWRDNDPFFLNNSHFKWDKLNKTLNDIDCLFFIKPHPYSKFKLARNYTNIKILPNNIDIYPLIPYINILITDYSSIYFDFILKKDPKILLFPFDYKIYIQENRDFSFDYDELMPGKRVYDFPGLLCALKNINTLDLSVPDSKIKDLFWTHPEDDSYNLIESIVDITKHCTTNDP